MKAFVNIFGVLLIVFGLASFGYQNFTYTEHEKVAQLGNLNVTTDSEKTLHIPPMLSGASIAVGIILIAIGMTKKNKK